MSQVYLMRAGRTDFDDQERIRGDLELPMNAQGESEIEAVIEELRSAKLDVILTSPKNPSRETAEKIGEALAVDVKYDDGLDDLDQGLWEGLDIQEVRNRYSKAFKLWQESPEDVCPPNGERAEDAFERVAKTLSRPLRKKKRIGIVAAEPLATLIKRVLTGDFVAPCPCHLEDTASGMVEILTVDYSDLKEQKWMQPLETVVTGKAQGGTSVAVSKVNGHKGDTADG